MTAETFYLFVTIYLVATTVIGLGVAIFGTIYSIRWRNKELERYYKKAEEQEEFIGEVEARMRGNRPK